MRYSPIAEKKIILFIIALLCSALGLSWMKKHAPAAAENIIYLDSTRLPYKQSSAVSGKMKRQPPAVPRRIPVNTAGEEELCLIDGVGPVIAQRIAAFRREHGAFQSPEDLLRVKGIGSKKLERIKEQIVLE